MRVDVAHDVLAPLGVQDAGREAAGDARGHAAHAQQQRHRARELLAIAGAVAQQEVGERRAAGRRRLAVAKSALEVALDRADVRDRRRGARAQAARERIDAPVGRRGEHAAGVVSAGADDPRYAGLVPARERDHRVTAGPRHRNAHDVVLARQRGRVRGGRGPQLRARRPRRVDDGAVGVAAAQGLARALVDAGGDARRRPRAVEDVERRAGGDELLRAQGPHRHPDPLHPVAVPEGVGLQRILLLAGVLHPAHAVERDEVDGLPVRPLLRAHAQHLAAVARPVQRSVVVVPAVLRRRGRAQRLGELLVVQQRTVAVEGRRRDVAAERRDGDDGRRQSGAAPLDALEPEEAREQQREREAGEPRQPQVVLHHRDGVERAERDRGRGGEPERAAAARDEGEQRGRGGDGAAAEDEHDPRPLVEAAVRRAHRRDGAEALADPGGEVVPSARGEQASGDAGRERARRRAARRRRAASQRAARAPRAGGARRRSAPRRWPRTPGRSRAARRTPPGGPCSPTAARRTRRAPRSRSSARRGPAAARPWARRLRRWRGRGRRRRARGDSGRRAHAGLRWAGRAARPARARDPLRT